MRADIGGAALFMSALVACQGGADAGELRGAASATSAVSSAAADLPTEAPSPAPTVWTPSPAPTLSPRRAAKLADDVATRVAAVHEAEEAPKHVEVVDGLFVVASGDARAPFNDAVDITRRMAAALYNGPLMHRPDEGAIVWIYSSSATFEKGALHHAVFAQPSVVESSTKRASGTTHLTDLGYFDPGNRTIVVRTDAGGLGTLAHECAHVLIDADFPKAPPWIGEGLPAVFEVPDLSKPGEVHGKAHFRLQTVRDALASKDPAMAASVRLDALFTMGDDFYGPLAHLHYGMAREALRWLDSLGKMWNFYALFRENVLEDANGTEAFARVFGKSPAEANDEWLAWIRSKDAEGTP